MVDNGEYGSCEASIFKEENLFFSLIVYMVFLWGKRECYSKITGLQSINTRL